MNIFKNLEEVYECYGEHNIIPVTALKQIIFYTSHKIQPKWICESANNEGHICCYFHKGETKKLYSEWLKRRPNTESGR
ncbi:hypothetical protein GPL15_20425 [Clostridium sp. MCC353]|uniref:hypothetical protein n=1 Tax=Clostridium sp. MCC353 TaxID=2592646 RepID=UPI001C00DD66|nr:hypothetical protein [Clostridium sp. MCC353]MBT9778849.1 hypothetical protein [Clostridium sp. MCC353]